LRLGSNQMQELSKNTVNIFLVDNEPIVRHGIKSLIKTQPNLEVCGQSSDAGDVLEQIQAKKPNLIILDVTLRTGSGLELIKQIKAFEPNVKILVYSSYRESQFGERAIRSGAMGYVNKKDSIERFLKGIKEVLDGNIFLSQNLSERMFHGGYSNAPVGKSSLIDTLSDREFEIFQLIGQGLETRIIADQLRLSVKTIETHRYNIKRKLFLESGNELTRYAFEWSLTQAEPAH